MYDRTGTQLTFNSQWYPQFDKPEKISKKSIVDPSGYIPPKERIENLIRAGERLDEVRREMYHYGNDFDGEDSDYEDPMVQRDLDLVDIQRMNEQSMANLARQASEAKEAAEKAATVKPSAEGPESEAKKGPSSEGNGAAGAANPGV